MWGSLEGVELETITIVVDCSIVVGRVRTLAAAYSNWTVGAGTYVICWERTIGLIEDSHTTWQAAKWPETFSSKGGCGLSRQCSVAAGHLSKKRHLDGGSMGAVTSPLMFGRSRW